MDVPVDRSPKIPVSFQTQRKRKLAHLLLGFCVVLGAWTNTGCFSAQLRDPESGQLKFVTDTVSHQTVVGECFGPVRLWVEKADESTRVYVDSDLNVELDVLSSTGNPQGLTDASLTYYQDAACSQSVDALVIPARKSEIEFYARAENMGDFEYGPVGLEAELVTTALTFKLLPEAVDHLSWQESVGELTFQEDISQTSLLTVWVQDVFGNRVTDAYPFVELSAFQDEGCETPALGTLSAKSNPALADQGVVEFERVRYSEAETIFLRASVEGLGIFSECLGPIEVED